MKSVALLVLLPGSLAVCQKNPQLPADPGLLFQQPPQLTLPQSSLENSRVFKFDLNHPPQALVVTPPTGTGLDQQIDPEIIHRPPASAFAQQPSRTPLAHDLYPDLKLLPVETARLEPIPITWPGFKAMPIPTTAPNAKVIPIQKFTLSTPELKPRK